MATLHGATQIIRKAPGLTKSSAKMARVGAVVMAAAMTASLMQPVGAQDGDLLPIPDNYFDEGLLPLPGDEPPDPVEPIPEQGPQVGPIPDGDYIGAWGLGGSWWLNTDAFTLIWTGQAAGPISFNVSEGLLDGQWSVDGGAATETRGLPIEATGSSQWSAAGAITGSDPYVIDGSGSGTTNSTVSAPGLGSQTFTDNYSFPANGQLDSVMFVCGQINGSWQQRFDDAFEGTGIIHSVTTYMAAVQVDGDDVDEDVADLTALVEEANLVQVNYADPAPSLTRLADIVARAEVLVAELGFNFTDCDPGEQFMRIITGRVQDVINSYLANWLGQDSLIDLGSFRQVVILGLRSGAMGAGGPDPARALFLEIQAEDILQRELNREFADRDSDGVQEILLTAIQLGITLSDPPGDGLSVIDLCMSFGLDVTEC